MGHYSHQTGHQPGLVAIPARGQPKKEHGIFLPPLAPDSLFAFAS